MTTSRIFQILMVIVVCVGSPIAVEADESAALPKAWIDGTGLGWQKLGDADFVNVNCAKDTWSWNDGVVHCTGTPTGVMRTKKQYTNFELVGPVAAPAIGW